MPPNRALLRLAGWSAAVNAAAGIAGFATLTIFFAAGGFWGALNDSLSVIWALSLLPVAWLLYQLHLPSNPSLSQLAAVLGVGGVVYFAALQALLLTGLASFEQTLGAVLAMNGVIGVWLVLNAWLARAGRTLPPGLVGLMLALGLALISVGAGFWLGGQDHPLAAAGFLVGAAAGAAWGVWLARLLLNGRLVAQLEY